MTATTHIFYSIGACQDKERSPIIKLPDEVLLDIFDSYRQNIIDKYDHYWRNKYGWFNLAHVCRRWRAVVFASSSRLDLNVIVEPVKPDDDIKSILSGHLPIIIDYLLYKSKDDTGSAALWRMLAALEHRDRVRDISFQANIDDFGKFIEATSYHFPALESLSLYFPHHEPEIPATFLRGPDRSDLPLRHLFLFGGSIAFSISGLLSSTTALTDLTLNFNISDPEGFEPSQALSLLACLQGMQRLRYLNLAIPYLFGDLGFPSWNSPVHKDKTATVPVSELTFFRYSGPNTFLGHLMSGLSAPSLQDVRFEVCAKSPLPYLSRVIDDVREEFRSVSIAFDGPYFHLLSSTRLGEIDHFEPSESSFTFDVDCSPHSIDSMGSTPSTKLAMAEQLTLNFPGSDLPSLENIFSMRNFLRQFRSVRLLRVNPFVSEIGAYLKQNEEDGQGAIFPVLEEIEISITRLRWFHTDAEEYPRRAAKAVAAFEPCIRAGRLVKVSHSEQTEMQSRNGRSQY
jgi:hypothetical protein